MNTQETEKPVIELPSGSYTRREENGNGGAVAVVPTNATSLLVAIERAASNPQADIEKMERLFAMHQQMVDREAKAAFNGAMARAQSQIQPIIRNQKNAHTNSNYEDIAAINVIVPLYTAEGLNVSFNTETKNDADPIAPGEYRTIAIVGHASGHERRYHIDLALDDSGSGGKINKTAVQAKGSTNSYARRYLLRMIFNLSTQDDDDGNGGKKEEKPRITDAARKDFETAIESTTDAKALETLWKDIVTACNKVGDRGAYDALKELVTAKGKTLKGKAKAAE